MGSSNNGGGADAVDRQTLIFLKASMAVSAATILFMAASKLERSLLLSLVVMAAGAVGLWLRGRELARARQGVPQNAFDPATLAHRSLWPARAWIKSHLKGQDLSIDQLCLAVDRNLRLGDSCRTLGNFLLVGPTGTGKTFLSELVSAALFPDHERVIIRMNQFKDASDADALTGRGGQLIEPVLVEPRRVILLDEIDKAHPSVLHTLYDVLDSGECRNKGTGRAVSFAGCVFIATANRGAEELRKARAESRGALEWTGRARDVMADVGGFEKPFLARWDEILLLDSLSPLHVAEVACLSISAYWARYGMDVSFASPRLLLGTLKDNDHFKQYGVRQLQQLIRSKSDRAILEARRLGLRVIRLDLGASGDFELASVRRSA